MAGGFPKVPALLAACFARCCTAPLCSLIYHCVHLLSLPSLSLYLPLRSQPCCRDFQFYVSPEPALLVVCLSSLRDSRICTIPVVVTARRQWPRPWLLRSVARLPKFVHLHVKYKICGYMILDSRAGKSARLSRCPLCFASPVKVAVLLHQRLHGFRHVLVDVSRPHSL